MNKWIKTWMHIENEGGTNKSNIYIYPKSPKAVLWRSLPNVAQKRIIAEKIIATAEVLRPRGYSNVVWFYGRGVIAMLLDSTAEGL